MPITPTGKKRDGKQQYRVRVNYVDPYGAYKQIERTAYGKAEALELEQKLTREVEETSAPKHMTVQQLYDEYMALKAQEVRETTYDKSRRNLEFSVLPTLGDVRIDKLNVQQLQRWKNAIGERDIKITTKQNYYKELRSLLLYAVRREYIPRNPLDLVGNFRSTEFEKPEEKLRYYTAAEYLRFAAAAKDSAQTFTDWAYYVFFSVAFYTGMRKGEINVLRWSDIDGNIIHVRRSVTQKLKGRGKYVETLPKTRASYRDLQIPQPLAEILADHRKRQENDSRFTEDYYVCGGTRCLPDSSIEKRNQKYAAAAGLPHIRIHDFRHTHATLLANEGINIQEVARRLGHDDVQVTWGIYAHLYPREEERAVAILDQIK